MTNPATGEVTGHVALGSIEDAHAVIDAAAAAFPAWRETSLAKRTAIMFAFRELLNARKHELAHIITSEHGKVVSDALGTTPPPGPWSPDVSMRLVRLPLTPRSLREAVAKAASR